MKRLKSEGEKIRRKKKTRKQNRFLETEEFLSPHLKLINIVNVLHFQGHNFFQCLSIFYEFQARYN